MSEFSIFIIAAITTAIVLSIVAYINLKKSFLLVVSITLVLVCLSIALMAYFVALNGIIHMLWAVPIAAFGVLRIFHHLTRSVRIPILKINRYLETLSEGNTNVELDTRYLQSNNEIGDIMRTFRNYLQMLNNVSDFAVQIGNGNLEAKYTLRGSEDQIGKSLLSMRQNLKNGIEEVRNVAELAAYQGDLTARIATDNKKGAWQSLGDSINDLLTSFITPIMEMNSVFERISKGDLTRRYEKEEKGDLARMKHHLNIALNNLDQTLSEVAINSQVLNQSSTEMSLTSKEMSLNTSEIAASMTQMSTGAQSQLNKVDEVSQLFEEIRRASQDMEHRADVIHGTSVTGAKQSEEGKNWSAEVSSGIQTIEELAIKANDTMQILKNRSMEIADALRVITEISSQTNLLALNAAIEAAQAGDAGRGFSVVAEEIRKLAEDSKQSARQIESLLEEVQKDTLVAHRALREMNEQIKESVGRSQHATETFQQIFESSQHTLSLSTDILKASRDQITRINEVVHITENIVVIAEETAAGTEQVSASTAELSSGMESFDRKLVDFKAIADSMKRSTDQLTFS